MIIFIRTFTQLYNLYLSESYTYYNVIFKNKNALYIIYEFCFHQSVMNLQILKITVHYNLEKYKHISRWNKVSKIYKKKKRQKEKKKKGKRFIRNYQSGQKTYKGKHNVKGDENT